MDSMDIKGIAWVGNIYQKFEAMCLEVEEAMCQETAKYVENQVQTVGASMKRFCSDVVHDLIPPSSKDLSQVASADLLLNPYLEFGIHKKSKSTSSVEEDENKSNCSNDGWGDWSAASINWEISDKKEAKMKSNEHNMKSNAKVGKISRHVSSSNLKRTERTDRYENVCISHKDPDVLSQVFRSNTGSSAECEQDLKEDNDANMQIMEAVEHESGFEETCVLVDRNDYCQDNHKQEIRPSYKKKIKNAFSLKNKSTRKQEYKQLAAQNKKRIIEADEDIPLAITPSNDSLDSEWELL